MVRLKAGKYTLIASAYLEFQFLMVRLKECWCVFGAVCSYISIPYGAIKSGQQVTVFIEQEPFQFLMVRLKEEIALIDLEKYFTFQFLMVRLKG